MSETITKTAAKRLRKKAKALSEESTRISLDLCEVLYESYYACVHHEGEIIPAWDLWGFDSWEHFVEKELGLHKGRAHNKRRVWSRMMVDLVDHWDTNLKLSFTKLRTLSCHTSIVTHKTVDSWTRKALTMTCCELDLALQGHVGEMTSFTVALDKHEAVELKNILAMARTNPVGLRRRGEAIMAIAREWVELRAKEAQKKGKPS